MWGSTGVSIETRSVSIIILVIFVIITIMIRDVRLQRILDSNLYIISRFASILVPSSVNQNDEIKHIHRSFYNGGT